MKKQQGFTLMEMMVVVAILGVLAAIVLPMYQKYVERGYLADAKQVLLSIRQQYEVDKMQKPNDYGKLADADTAVGKIKANRVASSTIKNLYTVNTLVSAVDSSNEKVHYLLASVTPKDAKKYGVYMTANGNVYKCKAGTITGTKVDTSKPSGCSEKL